MNKLVAPSPAGYVVAEIFRQYLPHMNRDKCERLVAAVIKLGTDEKIKICSQCGDWIENVHTKDECIINQVMHA